MATATDPPLVQVINALVPVVTLLLGMLGAWLTKKLASKLDSDKARSVALKVSELASDAVLALEQTTVGALKEAASDGRITDQEAADVKRLAIDKVKSMLGPNGRANVLKAFGFEEESQLEDFISTKIEAELHKARATIGRSLSSVLESSNTPES